MFSQLSNFSNLSTKQYSRKRKRCGDDYVKIEEDVKIENVKIELRQDRVFFTSKKK